MERKKIAILGGGAGALSAAFGLTENPDWQEQYEITVYQLGWRLGGKGASGRNGEHNERIEEHGLHVWGGFYENAFRTMIACYEEMGRSKDQPLATVWDAFKPQDFVTWMEDVDGKWERWDLDFPQRGGIPGDASAPGTLLDAIKATLAWIKEIFEGFPPIEEAAPMAAHPGWIAAVIEKAIGAGAAPPAFEDAAPVHRNTLRAHHHLAQLIDHVGDDIGKGAGLVFEAILHLAERIQDWFSEHVQPHVQHDARLRRLTILINFGLTSLLGVLRDRVPARGFNSIDDREWRDWLHKHGATGYTLESALVRGVYDFVFAYAGGDAARPEIAAGTCTRSLLRLVFNYKGSVFYEMQAGMGDTVFAPLYFALRKRGVKFKFFHRVENLRLSEDGKAIGRIEMAIQATLKPGVAEYAPLRDVKGLPCWPSRPLFDQLEQGEEIRAGDFDLESAWTAWKDPDHVVLKRGVDFDDVVLGISAGAFPYICQELAAGNERWQRMVDRVQTVSTQALQLWLKKDAAGLGWSFKTILTAYAHPIETWADMSQVLPREEWPAGDAPRNLAYFCGPMQDPTHIPPLDDHAYPERARDEVKQMSIGWLRTNTGSLWPGAVAAGDPAALDWELLVDPEHRHGLARLDAQFWRANINPSDRYVISLPGSTQHRLAPGDSGFENLYLAGDWVKNGLNFGCVESAVQGGLLASQALCGYPKKIAWLGD